MPIGTTIAAALLAILGAPSPAMAAPAQDAAMQPAMSQARDQGRDDRAMPGPDGSAARQANRASLRHVRVRQYEQRSMTRYRMDQRAYMREAARSQHRRAMNRYDRRVMRQRDAYAAAMASWRRQVRACNHGDHRACKRPTPRVADFY